MADTFPFVDEDGTWIEILGQPAPVPISAPVPALFLDRDGVVVVETHYLHEVEKTELISGAGATIALANQQGVRVVMVTNQGGIGRGLYGWAEFEAVQNKIKAELAAQGARFDAICACAHHPDGLAPYAGDHNDRKPKPGMLLKAARALEVDLARSWIVGDMPTDMGAGRNGGLAGGIHVNSGWPDLRQKALAEARDNFQVQGSDSIAGVPGIIPLLFD